VLLAPILPGLTDLEEPLESVMAAAAEHGAAHFGATLLGPPPVVKEHYLDFAGATFPARIACYERGYGVVYALHKPTRCDCRSELTACVPAIGSSKTPCSCRVSCLAPQIRRSAGHGPVVLRTCPVKARLPRGVDRAPVAKCQELDT
jgi:hypothetical protein